MTKLNFIFMLLLGLGPAAASAGEDPQAEIARLREDLARLQAAGSPERIAELARRIDLLAAEIEALRSGTAAEPEKDQPLEGEHGMAPSASKVYRLKRGVSLGGYGEAVYENFAAEREDGAPSGRTDQFDFLRQVLYVGYKFDDRILLNSEIEFEHASTGKGGEVSVEFAYADFSFSRAVGARAGMLLVPMGFLNELHEPPVFHGARRSEVESAIIPSTWRENGGGLYGEAGPVQWRAYVVSSLLSSGISAAGIRGARQSGARSKSEDFAFTGRMDFTGVDGLLLGAALFTGGTGQGAQVAGSELGGRLTLFEGHAQFERRGLQLRALYARSTLGDAARINAANNLAGARSVGEAHWGGYVQAAFDVMSLRRTGSKLSVTPFVRYEGLDTQDGVPAGFAEDPSTRRDVLTVGVGVRPIPQVALKVDWARQTNDAATGTNQFNLAVGYLF